MAYCTNCGAKIDDTAKFCPNCGAPIKHDIIESDLQKMRPVTEPAAAADNGAKTSTLTEADNRPESSTFAEADDRSESSTFAEADDRPESSTFAEADDQLYTKRETYRDSYQEPPKIKPSKKSKKKHHPVRNILIVLAAIVILLIIAGAVSENRSSGNQASAAMAEEASSENQSGSMETAATPSNSSTSDTSDFAEVVDKEDEEEKLEPIDLQIGNLLFKIPGYYTASDSNNDEQYMYSYEVGNTAAGIIVYVESAGGINRAQFRDGSDAIQDNIIDSLDDTMELTKSEQTEYMGMPGYACDLEGTYEGEKATADLDFFLDEDNDQIELFLFVKAGNPPRDVSADYINMMKSAEKIQTTAKSGGSNSNSSKSSQKKAAGAASSDSGSSSSGVTPEVKAVLDSYEKLMNDYCDFMEKYKNADSSDALSMLSDYYKMLDEYTEAMNELNDLDTNNMSTADYEYYLDVTNRINKRLLEVAQ